MRSSDLIDDVQTEAETTRPARRRGLGGAATKWVEERLQRGARDHGSGVLHGERDMFVLRAKRHADHARLGRIVDRIADEVRDDLLEAACVPPAEGLTVALEH